jgi:queuosine precursor transporter
MRVYKHLDQITAFFVAGLLISNIASSAKIIDWGFNLFGVRIAFDAGTLIFPFSYIIDDVLTEVYGYAKSRRIIWLGFFCSALMGLILWAASVLPGEKTWQEYAGDKAYTAILGGVASFGILIASLSGYLAGEFSNSYILAKLKIKMNGRRLWVRTIGSTIIGELFDTSIFVSIACLLKVFPWEIAPSLILTNYIFKTLVEILMTPVTYRIVKILKKSENEDFYDHNTDFNPFGKNA